MSDTTDKASEQSQGEETSSVTEDLWMVRDCYVYKDEYDECTSVRGRFQQIFVYGETQDCNNWKKDYNNCCKWTNSKDHKALDALINNEKERRLARLRAHYGNTTWKPRKSPPDDWNRPLPEWMVKRDENTYLAIKAKELREGKPIEEVSNYKCVIM